MNELNCLRSCAYPSGCSNATCGSGTTTGGAASVVASVGLVALAVVAAL